ncbi:MerR family transcriptional regulator [Calidifontibacter terrae]
MLRHYDQLGLVPAARVDKHSGYRFYEPEQLPRVHALLGLKDLGFTLEQIKPMLAGQIDSRRFHDLLDERRAALRDQIDADRRRLDEVERRLRLMDGSTTMEFTEKSLPELSLSQRTAVVADQSEIGPVIGPMFQELVSAQLRAGDHPMHPAYAWYSGEGSQLRFGAGFATRIDGAEQGHLDPVERAVTMTYVGAMEGIGVAWAELGSYVAAQQLRPFGPCREVYLNTEGPEAGWVTELQQPVRS